ncbi:unnamed protein product [Ectocarpus sp. CCAP 1310/34]|nr:unnamed protein product [Ectocarpus sp. CCAP 1310/34]
MLELNEESIVGLLGAINPVASFFWTPVACAFADRHNIQQQVVYVASILYAVTRPSVLLASSFLAVAAVEISVSVSESPVGSLVDAAIRHASGGDGFGSQRLWGAVGFGTASLVAGYVCDLYGGSFSGVMLVFVGNVLVALMASTGVPIGQVNNDNDNGNGNNDQNIEGASGGSNASGEVLESADRENNDKGIGWKGVHQEHKKVGSSLRLTVSTSNTSTAATVAAAAADNHLDLHDDDDDDDNEAQTTDGDALLEYHPGDSRTGGGGKREGGEEEGAGEKAGVVMAIRIMLSTDESASFFTAVVLSGMGRGVIDTFLFIRLEELGGSRVLCGLARLIMCMAEVPFFYLSGPLIRRAGARGVIALAQLAYLTRFVYYSVLREPWWVLPSEVLHGLTFAAMWAATTDYAHQIAPG